MLRAAVGSLLAAEDEGGALRLEDEILRLEHHVESGARVGASPGFMLT
jgi:hypothetical protein